MKSCQSSWCATAKMLTIGGLQFRDLNANSTLDAYEDWRLPTAERAANLLSQMTLAEKAGTLMHGTAPGNATGGVNGGGSGYDLLRAAELIQQRHVTSMITRLATEPAAMAVASNALQEIAEASRLGIPLTLSTDPRNHFQFTAGAAVLWVMLFTAVAGRTMRAMVPSFSRLLMSQV